MANDSIRNEIADKLFDNVKGIIETGSGGEIKIYRNPDEAAAARKRMVDEVARRLETDPLVLELARLELEFQISQKKGVGGETAEEAAAAEAAPAEEAAK